MVTLQSYVPSGNDFTSIEKICDTLVLIKSSVGILLLILENVFLLRSSMDYWLQYEFRCGKGAIDIESVMSY
jgi:type III secretory pathway component EscU